MEDIITALFLRFSTWQDAVDLLAILCAEYFRQDGRKNECATPWAQCSACWSAHYIRPAHVNEQSVPLLSPAMALQLLKERFDGLAPTTAPANPANVTPDPTTTDQVNTHWTFLRALVLVMLYHDHRMRRLLLCSPSPFWPSPPPRRAQLFLSPDGPFAAEVQAFLAIHSETQSTEDAHSMAYDFVRRSDHIWINSVFV
jgi:hypothetical protein